MESKVPSVAVTMKLNPSYAFDLVKHGNDTK
ncbi:MAG: hypothetical protein UZ09_BCD002002028 [Bacteroidetes bacterium OLB9]|nr:MAG: hypothetical protein UZ09_BCD002002028 [Bacteroidetes bacterium OLB9]